MNRRHFLKLSARAVLGCAVGGFGYGVIEAKWIHVLRVQLPVPNLDASLRGMSIAFLADIHHGPFVPLSYVREVVKMTNELQPDLVALGGDYVHHGTEYIVPGIAELAHFESKLGTFAVLGNHDHYSNGTLRSKAALQAAGITELTNSGVWIERGGARLRLCGVGDFWRDVQHLPAALGEATTRDAVILLSHNPDYVERIRDPRVGLVLSGHTHGGQVSFPIIGAPIVPSLYGQKYTHGLVQGPVARVFVTRGVGTITPPVRFRCQPEIVLATLG
ncbi:MAG: uncharacterized protein QOD99_1124 [Chthoniobacter sp.]|jgi:predicted MPP superfamily phosphohydrolase|nr:uncharacterized protein [Chthoniobacter sp.]